MQDSFPLVDSTASTDSVKSKLDLSDLSLIIPIRIDGLDRMENLVAILTYFERFTSNVEAIIVESAPTSNCQDLPVRFPFVRHIFEPSNVELLHRTRMINHGITFSDRRFIGSWDADVLVEPDALASGMEFLRNGGKHSSIPYNRITLDISGQTRLDLIKEFDFRPLPHISNKPENLQMSKDVFCLSASSVGGAVLLDRRRFIDRGGYNEKFVSWGFEDLELAYRLGTLGMSFSGVPERNLYHLSHKRLANSSPANPMHRRNSDEWDKVKQMGREELRRYVKEELLPQSAFHA